MTIMGEAPNGERRAQLERRAAVVRERLEARLQLLEQRRDGLVQRVRTLTTPPVSIALVAVVGVCALAWFALRVRRARPRGISGLVLRAAPPKRSSGLGKMLQKALLSAGIAMLRRAGTRSFDRWLAAGPHRALPASPTPMPPPHS